MHTALLLKNEYQVASIKFLQIHGSLPTFFCFSYSFVQCGTTIMLFHDLFGYNCSATNTYQQSLVGILALELSHIFSMKRSLSAPERARGSYFI
jgi:hypothetical protein